MKNLYLIPTDKPSSLIINKGKLEFYKNEYLLLIEGKQHIYITSDEEIKMDDWYLDDTNSVRQAITECESYWTHRKKYQKIILTTDQDLIKDGVQAIDDDFLEWFVRNPSCEWVKVRKNPKVHFIVKGKGVKGFNQGYKIIIPKEEPKQETLEEAAFRLFPRLINDPYNPKEDDNEESREDFIDGAKWQAERMYSNMEEYSAFVLKSYKERLPLLLAKDWFKQFKKK